MGLFSSPEKILAARIKKARLLKGQLPEFTRKSSLEDLRLIQGARKEIEDATTGMYCHIPFHECWYLFLYLIEMYQRVSDWNNAERKAEELVDYCQNFFTNDDIDINIRVDAVTQAAQEYYGSTSDFAQEMVKEQDDFLRRVGQYTNDAFRFVSSGPVANEIRLKYLAIATNKYGNICRYNGKQKKAAFLIATLQTVLGGNDAKVLQLFQELN